MKSSGEIKLFVGILIVALVLVGVAVYPLIMGPPRIDKLPDPSKIKASREELIPPGSHLKGKPDAPFTLIVFSDFQCPLCAQTETAIAEELKKRGDKLNIVFRHFQAALSHQHTQTLAQAAEAAGQQGKFWEMHDLLFKNQPKFKTMPPELIKDELVRMAQSLRLNPEKFKTALAGKETEKRFMDDQFVGEKFKFAGTPTFVFITPESTKNGEHMELHNLEQMVFWLKDESHWK